MPFSSIQPTLAALARWAARGARALAAAALAAHAAAALAQVELADQPPRTAQAPANVLLALSVEWPTGTVQAYNDEPVNGCTGRSPEGHSVCYFDPPLRARLANQANASNPNWRVRASMPYLGYFDPYKCYQYSTANGWFEPVGPTLGFTALAADDQQPAASRAQCSGAWSGNFLNWSTMQTIDLFRWAMTGGSRTGASETTSLTVLRKAFHDGSGAYQQFPIKRIDGSNGTPPSAVAPVAAGQAALFVRVQGLSARLRHAASAAELTADPPGGTELYVRVRVCVADPGRGIRREANCRAYAPALADSDPTNDASVDPASISYKPVGLIQENAMVARFATFGYLNDPDPRRDGGVMRARMKFVGPDQPARSSSGRLANAGTEWDRNTGILVTNPDAADANATNADYGLSGTDLVAQSGVIQYLNEFGRKAGYKRFDPVSELYYETLRYYKAIGPTPEYASMALTPGTPGTKVDGFPVITRWDDPLAPPTGFGGADLQAWCPKNFVVGIADANNHKDKRLPGNTAVDEWDTAAQPSNPDGAINVSALLNEIIATERANEGVTPLNALGAPLAPGVVNSFGGSAYVASLAYYANTRDLRPDGAALQTRGKQTVQTFYVDVREAGGWGMNVSRDDPARRNQLWLAAKYGGFVDQNTPAGQPGRLDAGDAVTDYNRDGRTDVRDVWDRDGDGLPDTYFEAGTPEALVEGLRNAFAQIRASAASAVGVGLGSRTADLGGGTGLYRVSYDPRTWSGGLLGLRYTGFDAASGVIGTTRSWEAAEQLARQHWDTGRRIVTMRRDASASAPVAVPFRWASLSGAQQSALGSESVLQFVRGRTDLPGTRLRLRYDPSGQALAAPLGDIVDSEPRYVGPPGAAYGDAFNPGYEAFRSARAQRPGVLYVGANDGMLHAFDADIGATPGRAGGSELFAYVPSFVFAGPTGPDADGLRALASPNYAHRYYVNATPAAGDVDFARTFSATGRALAQVPANAPADWRSLLVSGLGKGGRGYFALDVTEPGAFGTEAGAAQKVLWEFSDPDMGFSFGLAQLAKTRRWGWVVLLTSGYNPARAPAAGQGAYLFVVDARSGQLLQKIAVPGAGASLGLAQITAYSPDAADGTITEAYGGDLEGNVWRFDFNAEAADVPAPVNLAQLRDAAGRAQPVTTGPVVRVAPLTRNRYVFVGTGRLLGPSDLYNSAAQSFYALRDGTRVAAWQPGRLPAPIDFPLTRAKTVQQADLTAPIARDASRPGGWFFDLPNVGERVLVDTADTDFGTISWLGSIPDSNNPCAPAGGSRLYAAGFETGQSQLYAPESLVAGAQRVRAASIDPRASSVGMRLARVDGNVRAVVTGQLDELRLTQGYLRYLNPRALSWREVLEPGR